MGFLGILLGFIGIPLGSYNGVNFWQSNMASWLLSPFPIGILVQIPATWPSPVIRCSKLVPVVFVGIVLVYKLYYIFSSHFCLLVYKFYLMVYKPHYNYIYIYNYSEITTACWSIKPMLGVPIQLRYRLPHLMAAGLHVCQTSFGAEPWIALPWTQMCALKQRGGCYGGRTSWTNYGGK